VLAENLAENLAKSGEAAKSGPIGLAIILVLCIVCYFLFKSMSKHLKTVREEFPIDPAAPVPPAPPAVPPSPVRANLVKREADQPANGPVDQPSVDQPAVDQPAAESPAE
jgi:hypothetical protein